MSPDELGKRVWELRGTLLRLACAIVRNPQDAEDAVSEAVVRAFENLSALRSDAAARPWLTRITVRCCYERARRSRRESLHEDVEPLCQGEAHASAAGRRCGVRVRRHRAGPVGVPMIVQNVDSMSRDTLTTASGIGNRC